jgi:predicted nuclease of restriction endonuclease-like (RecB) superfamily
MNEVTLDNRYKDWLVALKTTIQQRQIKAAVAVNRELIQLYWELGKQIVEKQETAQWGSGFVDQLSKDLVAEFPDIRGLSSKNLRTCRQFYLFYSDGQFWKQLVSKMQAADNAHTSFDEFENMLFSIPWGHHILIMQKNSNQADALFYIHQTIENNWSRAILQYHIETQLHKRQGNAITNFKNTLPQTDSDLAQQILKDPYNFEFLSLEKSAKEKDLERELIGNITQLLLELGKGFAYLGKQFLLKIGDKEYRTDLLFYHILLRRYVVIELKLQEFQPEFVGKLNFYISAVNTLLKSQNDNDTIGILLCKNKDNFEVEFALRDVNKPIGVSEFTYRELSEEIKNALPHPEDFNFVIKHG